MSRKSFDCLRADGEPKKEYPSEMYAKNFAYLYGLMRHERFTAYECENGHWHIGHRDNNKNVPRETKHGE